MSHEADSSAARVLHIRSGESRHVASMISYLDESGAVVETFGDVYTALARLCAPPRAASIESLTIRAVVVDMSGLGTTEMEFFSLLSRSNPGLPAYVYGPDHLEAQITEALSRGAVGVATEQIVRSLAASALTVCEEDEQSDAPVHDTETLEPAPAEDTTVEPVPVEDATVGDEEPNPQTESPPRVPWLRYADTPARLSPRRPPSNRVDAPETVPSVGKEDPPKRYEPLLSEDELRALLGDDDIAAIAPDNPARAEQRDGQP